jgi:hypothetical protein
MQACPDPVLKVYVSPSWSETKLIGMIAGDGGWRDLLIMKHKQVTGTENPIGNEDLLAWARLSISQVAFGNRPARSEPDRSSRAGIRRVLRLWSRQLKLGVFEFDYGPVRW